MAKYEDYLAKRDGVSDALEKEIADSGEYRNAPAGDDFQIPERFANKAPQEIAKSYVELERKFSQQGNDLGQLRRTVDQLIALQSQPKETPPQEEEDISITLDDLYNDPQSAISRITRASVDPKLSRIEQELVGLRNKLVEDDLTKKFPNWRETAKDPQFTEWVQEKAYRKRMAAAAAQNDSAAAEELLSMYEDFTGSSRREAEDRRSKALSNASLERGSSNSGRRRASGETFSRTELGEVRIRAMRGDQKAERWLKANGQAIREAYAEGRVTD